MVYCCSSLLDNDGWCRTHGKWLKECDETYQVNTYCYPLHFNSANWMIYVRGHNVFPPTVSEHSTGMKWTGERVIPSDLNFWPHLTFLTHCMEYERIGNILTQDMTVIDCACGVGYGSQYVSQYAKYVVGVDISEEAIEHARMTYMANNLSFIVADARKLPLDSDSYDVFISIETIEHFAGADKFISEIHRVLKPGGLLYLTTPDGDTYPNERADIKRGDFHYCHYRKSELQEMFGDTFDNIQITREGMNGDCYRVLAIKSNGEEQAYVRK